MPTAIRATERLAAISRTRALRKAIFSVPMVALRCCSPMWRTAVACCLARPKTVRTGSARSSSRSWAERSSVTSAAFCTRFSVYQPINAAKTGISGTVTAIRTADGQSVKRIHAPTSGGTITAVTSAGR